MSAPGFLFVSGFYRSGTSLLWALLNQHPEIALFYEANMLSIPLRPKLRYHRKWLANAEYWGTFIERHGLRSDKEVLEMPTAADVYRHFARRKGALYGGEKDPALCDKLPQILREFPRCKLIVIFRDPAQIYSSVLRAGGEDRWLRRPGMLERLIYFYEKLIADCQALYWKGVKILYIDYEKLTCDTEASCRQICEYLEIPFDPRMTDLSEANLDPVYAGILHSNLRSRRIVPPRQVGETVMSQETRDFLVRFGNRCRRLFRMLETKAEPSTAGANEPSETELERYVSRGRNLARSDNIIRQVYHLLPPPVVALYKTVRRMALR